MSASAGTATPAQIIARATVPVLCYHQIRPWTAADTSYVRSQLVCPPDTFRSHLDALKGAGYTTISPAAYREHLLTGASLPAKPVILSFDDGKDSQAQVALPELRKRDMTGVFFVMTVILDKTGWLRSSDVKAMADAGMTIGSHTWDHHRVDKYGEKDWSVQLVQPRETLRKISGQEVTDFAFPYGAWKAYALPHLAAAGYTASYQLNMDPMDPGMPMQTLRRTMVDSYFTGDQLLAHVAKI